MTIREYHSGLRTLCYFDRGLGGSIPAGAEEADALDLMFNATSRVKIVTPLLMKIVPLRGGGCRCMHSLVNGPGSRPVVQLKQTRISR